MSPIEPKSEVPGIPDHVLVRVIGSGAYGDVWLGRTILGTARAIKVIQRSSFERDQPFLREFEGVRRYEPVSRSSPSLVPILQVGRDEAAGFFYSVMELADAAAPRQPAMPEGVHPGPASEAQYEARTLRTDLVRQGRLSIADCVEVGLAMAEALQALHGAGLVHRDIKPSNIIYLRGRACLADVGLVSEARESSSCVGTAGYMAPEGPGLRRPISTAWAWCCTRSPPDCDWPTIRRPRLTGPIPVMGSSGSSMKSSFVWEPATPRAVTAMRPNCAMNCCSCAVAVRFVD